LRELSKTQRGSFAELRFMPANLTTIKLCKRKERIIMKLAYRSSFIFPDHKVLKTYLGPAGLRLVAECRPAGLETT
jgi:hypothetical protein